MNQQKINISDLRSDLTSLINQIMQGGEVILTRVDKPIAIVSPFSFDNSVKERRTKKSLDGDVDMVEESSTNSEWWIG